MGIADRSHHYWTARWEGGISIDDLVDAFMGGGTVFADKQLVVTRTLDPNGMRFSGEIDINNCGAVGSCLNAMAAEGDVHLDVTSLIFCDISGIRAFVDAAHHRESGRLLLHGLPDLLQTVMRVTGWADLPNLVVCDCKAGLA